MSRRSLYFAAAIAAASSFAGGFADNALSAGLSNAFIERFEDDAGLYVIERENETLAVRKWLPLLPGDRVISNSPKPLYVRVGLELHVLEQGKPFEVKSSQKTRSIASKLMSVIMLVLHKDDEADALTGSEAGERRGPSTAIWMDAAYGKGNVRLASETPGFVVGFIAPAGASEVVYKLTVTDSGGRIAFTGAGTTTGETLVADPTARFPPGFYTLQLALSGLQNTEVIKGKFDVVREGPPSIRDGGSIADENTRALIEAAYLCTIDGGRWRAEAARRLIGLRNDDRAMSLFRLMISGNTELLSSLFNEE